MIQNIRIPDVLKEAVGAENDGNIIFKLRTGVYIARNHKRIFSNTKLNLRSILYSFEIEQYC